MQSHSATISNGPPIAMDTENPGDVASSSADNAWLLLTARVRHGDPAALEKLYLAFFDLVLREIRIVTGRDEATCLDLAQETFLNVLRRIRPINEERKLRGWIRAVARTTSLDWLRGRARELRHLVARAESGINGNGSLHDGTAAKEEDWIDLQARTLLLQRELAALPSEIHEMMSLRYRLGWTLARIGQRLGKQPGAVDGQIRRTIERLREQMKGHCDE
jgi:RNA polymerase sigma factor (sigma-70 family)